MAEKFTTNTNNQNSSNGRIVPSNEEVIDELIEGLDSVCTKSEESGNNAKEERTVEPLSQEKETCTTETDNEGNETHPDSNSNFDSEELCSKDDDFIDEVALKDLEVTYTEDDKERLRAEAGNYKNEGNDHFKTGEYNLSAHSYTLALRTCPLAFEKDRAVMYSNRAAAKMKVGLAKEAIEDCTKAVELDSRYLKAYFRRAQLYEETEKLDEALADYQKVLELDPLHREALYSSKEKILGLQYQYKTPRKLCDQVLDELMESINIPRLPEQIQERNEKMKTEMFAKLKDLGNLVLRPFGLSTDNFQLTQDPNTGGYSVNFKQNSS